MRRTVTKVIRRSNSGVRRLDWVTKQLYDPEVRRRYLAELRVLAGNGDEWARGEIARIERAE